MTQANRTKYHSLISWVEEEIAAHEGIELSYTRGGDKEAMTYHAFAAVRLTQIKGVLQDLIDQETTNENQVS